MKALEYRCTSVEEMYPEHENLFDIVIASEVVEHVSDPQTFLYNCCSLIKVWYFLPFVQVGTSGNFKPNLFYQTTFYEAKLRSESRLCV